MTAPVHQQIMLPFEEFFNPAQAPAVAVGGAAEPIAQAQVDAVGALPHHAHQPAPTTLGELYSILDSNPSKEWRHVQTKSAVNQIAKVLQRPLSDIPMDPSALRPLIAAAIPASLPMTDERWSRCVGLTFMAIRVFHPDLMPRRQLNSLSDAWGDWYNDLPTKQLKSGLSRFVHYCSRIAVEPAQVAPETFERYRDALENQSLQDSPTRLFRLTVGFWNKAVAGKPGWGDRAVPLEPSKRCYALAWETFPPSFQEDVEEFLNHQRNQDVFSDRYRRQPREATITSWRREIRGLASILIGTGFPSEQLTSLNVLIENGEIALRARHARGGAAVSRVGHQAAVLALVARYWVRDDIQAGKLRVIANNAIPKRTGMTNKNRGRLNQFELEANKRVLVRLPAKIFAQLAQADDNSVEGARRAMYALALALLLVAPMRARNLVGLEQNRHFITHRRGRETLTRLFIPGGETKNSEDFEMRLADEERRLLSTYLALYRPRICSQPSPYLFPNSSGKMRNVTGFSQLFCDFIRRETGLILNIHLFRSLAVKMHLDVHPADIETGRRILGHRNTETTLRYYAERKAGPAFEKLGQTVAKLRVDPMDIVLSRPTASKRRAKAKK
jgi:integrase